MTIRCENACCYGLILKEYSAEIKEFSGIFKSCLSCKLDMKAYFGRDDFVSSVQRLAPSLLAVHKEKGEGIIELRYKDGDYRDC